MMGADLQPTGGAGQYSLLSLFLLSMSLMASGMSSCLEKGHSTISSIRGFHFLMCCALSSAEKYISPRRNLGSIASIL